MVTSAMMLAEHEALVVVRGIRFIACSGGSCFRIIGFRKKSASWGYMIVIDCPHFIVQERQSSNALPDGSLIY